MRQRGGVLHASDHDDVRRPGATNRVHQLLHASGLVAHAGAGSAVTPTAPGLRCIAIAVRKRLVEQIENDAIVAAIGDRKSTRLNSSHSQISYAVFCLKKKKKE